MIDIDELKSARLSPLNASNDKFSNSNAITSESPIGVSLNVSFRVIFEFSNIDV